MLFILVTFLCNFAVIKLQYSQTDYTVVIKTIVLSVFCYGYHLHKITITALPFYEIHVKFYHHRVAQQRNRYRRFQLVHILYRYISGTTKCILHYRSSSKIHSTYMYLYRTPHKSCVQRLMANKDLNTNYFMQQQHSRRYNSDLFEFRTKTAAAAGRTFDCGLCSSIMYYILYVLNVSYI